MIERIIEHWLTKAGERTYEVPFTQLLIAEGYRVLHGPVHHPFEHGKDLIAYSPEGQLCAFQLKGGDIALADLDQHQGQLLTLLATAVSYPGVDPPRRPDRAFLVTNGVLSPPARDRLSAINVGHRDIKLGAIEVIEREQLVSRLSAVYGQYVPAEAQDLTILMKLLSEDGMSLPSVQTLSALHDNVIGPGAKRLSTRAYSRANAAALFVTAYAAGPWERSENHLGVALAWLTLAASVLRHAARSGNDEADWIGTYSLAMANIREPLDRLLEEAVNGDDLLVPDLAESFVYAARAALVCGFAAAHMLSDSWDRTDANLAQRTRTLIMRELPFIRLDGEVAVPFIITIATALEVLGDAALASNLVSSCARTLAETNQPASEGALADPYHSFEDCLSPSLAEADMDSAEDFSGRSFGLPIALDWLARRNARSAIEPSWKAVTRITFCEFNPSPPSEILAVKNDDGALQSWHMKRPQSWSELVASARTLDDSMLPTLLWQQAPFIPFLGLLFPYRFNRTLAKALDYYFVPETILTVERDEPLN